MSGLEYHRLRDAEEVASMANVDRVLIVTADGVRQTTREAVLGALGGADITDWDARASRVPVGIVPMDFQRRYLVSTAIAAALSASIIDAAGQNITKRAANDGGLAQSYWSLQGSIPETGNLWVAFNADCSNAATVQRVYIGRQVVDSLVGSETGDCYGMIEFTGTQIKAKRFDTNAESISALANPLQKVLLQITPTEITVYGDGGFIFSLGTRPADDLLIGGAIISSANVTQLMHVNTTDTASTPRSPDAGFTGLSMLDSVLPADIYPTDIVFTRTASVFRDHLLQQGLFYMLAAGDDTIGLLDERHVATLANENRFQKAVGYSADYVLASGPYGLSATFVGERANASYLAFTTGRLSNVTLIGKAFPNLGAGSYSNLFGFGSVFGTLTGGVDNLGVGQVGNSLTNPSDGNTMLGVDVANQLMHANYSTIVGAYASSSTMAEVSYSTIVGMAAGMGWNNVNTDVVQYNTVYGSQAMQNGHAGDGNTAVGDSAMWVDDTSPLAYTVEYNVAIGASAMKDRTGAQSQNVAVGTNAMASSGAATNNTAVGAGAGQGLAGDGNVAVGHETLNTSQAALTNCTAVGSEAMTGLGATANSSALGYQATVTGDNQVQLGNSATTTFAYGAVQSRSDARDKENVRDTSLGLNFILSLRPVDYQWDYREDYLTVTNQPVPPPALYAEPTMQDIDKNDPRYDSFYTAYLVAHSDWQKARDNREEQMKVYRRKMVEWQNQSNLANVKKDGTKRRARFHHGFIAQEVKAVADAKGVDFGGYQDHSLNGGKDVRSLGYEEFIGPIVKSVQELDAKLTSDELISAVTERVIDKIMNDPDNRLFDVIADRMMTKLAAARRT